MTTDTPEGPPLLKARIPKAIAADAMKAALRSVEKRSDIPVLKYVLMQGAGEHLRITASDLDRRFEIALFATIEEPGEIVVPAKMLAEALKKWPEGEPVEISTGDVFVSFRCGPARLKVPTLPVNDFPEFPVTDIEHAFSIAGSELARALVMCLPAVSDDETRYYLNGVYMGEDREANLAFVGTDGHRLCRVRRPMPEDAGGFAGIIIPTAAASEIARVAAEMKGEPVEVEICKGKIRVRAGDVTYSAKLIEGTYPDYERIIPASFVRSGEVQASDLAVAIGRAAVASDAESRRVAVTLAGDKLEVSAKSTGGEAEAEAPAAWEGEPLTVGVNSHYALDLLEPFGKGRAVLSFQGTDDGPVVVTSTDLDDVTMLIMPMRG